VTIMERSLTIRGTGDRGAWKGVKRIAYNRLSWTIESRCDGRLNPGRQQEIKDVVLLDGRTLSRQKEGKEVIPKE